MKIVRYEGDVHTAGRLAAADLTDEVTEAVRRSGVRDGLACLWSPHTTCCFRFGHAGAVPPAPAASGVLPVRDGELVHTSAPILFVELDRDRDRRWLLEIVGD